MEEIIFPFVPQYIRNALLSINDSSRSNELRTVGRNTTAAHCHITIESWMESDITIETPFEMAYGDIKPRFIIFSIHESAK